MYILQVLLYSEQYPDSPVGEYITLSEPIKLPVFTVFVSEPSFFVSVFVESAVSPSVLVCSDEVAFDSVDVLPPCVFVPSLDESLEELLFSFLTTFAFAFSEVVVFAESAGLSVFDV